MSHTIINDIPAQNTEVLTIDETAQNTGLHFLTENAEEVTNEDVEDREAIKSSKCDLLEYLMRNDGSVVCKLCGEVLQSRTHWYRHKYKQHVIQPLNPSPLFQCEQCLVYFKSRKGYIGHIASRHSETLADSSPVLTNSQAEAAKEKATPPEPLPPETEDQEPDPEMSIPKACVLNYQTASFKPATPVNTGTVVKNAANTKVPEVKKPTRRISKDAPPGNPAEIEEKRSREEKLVADIINRVRRECEAQGSGAATRRGYSRRYTVMHT